MKGGKPILKEKDKPKKERKKTITQLKKILWELVRQEVFKKYGTDCYTCPSKNLEGSNRHCGHFISSSICSTEMRYSLDNLRAQCYVCNVHRSGNWLAYEQHLKRDGIDVEELKQRNERTKNLHYGYSWICGKIEEYKKLNA